MFKTALAYVVCAVVWGTTWHEVRVCIGPGGYPTLAAAALRFSLAAGLLLGLWRFGLARPGPSRPSQWRWLVLAGTLNAIGYSLVYFGEERISGGLAAVLFVTSPLMVALVVTVAKTERVHRSDLVGALIALSGIVVMFQDRLSVSTDQAVGIGITLLSVFVSAIYSVIVKQQGKDLNPLASTTVFIVVTACVLWLATLVRWEPLPWPLPVRPTFALVYLGVFGSVVAFSTYFYLLKRVSMMTATTLVFVLPLVALTIDHWFEEEVVLNGTTYAGVGITLLGVMVTMVLRRRATSRSMGGAARAR